MESINSRIKEKVSFYKTSINRLTWRDYSDISQEEIIKMILKEDPLKILSNILPYITYDSMIKKFEISCDDLGGGQYDRCEIYSNVCLDEFYKIINVEVIGEGGVIENINEEMQINYDYSNFRIKFEKVYYNTYSNKVELRGIYEGNSYDIYALDYCALGVELAVTGIKKNIIIPSWCEYIIEGLANIEHKNYKVAFFNICAGFDNFINEIYEDIFDYYLDHYSVCTNDNIRNEDKEIIRKFANKEQRLRNKLNAIFNILKINKKHGFEKLRTFSDIWDKEYTKIRDRIAHGGTYDNKYNLEDVAYTILTIIFSILLHEDLAENQWSTLIEF